MRPTEAEGKIAELVPHIFKRPLLHVAPTDSLLKVGTFLAIGPQIYVDGLVVLDNQDNDIPVGRIGGQHIIRYIMQNRGNDKWLKASASQIMNDAPSVVNAEDALDVALHVFGMTKFAFVPIAVNDRVVTSLSVRDVVKVVANSDEGSVSDIPVERISSSIIAVENHTSIGDALKLMLEKGIRNLAVRGHKKDRVQIINDRKILEYLISYQGRKMLAAQGPESLENTRVDILDMPDAVYVKGDLPARSAARLFDVDIPCLLLHNGSIVSPWDIVMKGLELV
jgi:predicted transcriptional regulator